MSRVRRRPRRRLDRRPLRGEMAHRLPRAEHEAARADDTRGQRSRTSAASAASTAAGCSPRSRATKHTSSRSPGRTRAARSRRCSPTPSTRASPRSTRSRSSAAPRHRPADIDPLTEAEVEEIAAIALKTTGHWGPEFWALILWMAWTGMRPGETCGLQVSATSTGRATVRIERNMRNDGTTGPVKGKRRRTIPLADQAAASRTALRRTNGQLFRTPTGKPLRPNSLRHYWIPVRAAFTAQLADEHWLRRRLDDRPRRPARPVRAAPPLRIDARRPRPLIRRHRRLPRQQPTHLRGHLRAPLPRPSARPAARGPQPPRRRRRAGS